MVVGAPFPVGVADAAEPSGMAPPGPSALPGFTQRSVTDFTGTSLPGNWGTFADPAAGDPGSQWSPTHVTVGGGVLSLNAWRDPAYADQWVTGGACDCADPHTYGAFFVRSRETGPGPTVVELLWPTSGWPPEIDFNETNGSTTFSFATLHWASQDLQTQVRRAVDLTQWHTWGVVWTPTSVVYTLDGRPWGVVNAPGEVPHVPLTLHIQQQTWCSQGYACPTSDQSTLVDWVAYYAYTPRVATIGPFAAGSAAIDAPVRRALDAAALAIARHRDPVVSVVGSGDPGPGGSTLGRRRAQSARAYLLARLAALGDRSVLVAALPEPASSAARGLSARVVSLTVG